MAREVTDDESVTWTCIEAYAGLHDGEANREAARAVGEGSGVTVVCTPSGGARSVRLELPADWDAMDDDALLSRIRAALQGAS